MEKINYAYRQWVPARKSPPGPRLQRKWQVGDPGLPKMYASPVEEILRVNIASADDFDCLVTKGRPFVMEGLDLGRCTRDWTVSELTKKIGPQTMVSFTRKACPGSILSWPRLPFI